MTHINLTTLETMILDSLRDVSINSTDIEWVSSNERGFVNFSDASKWATENGLTAVGSDDEIIRALYSLVEKGLVTMKDSRRKSSFWFSQIDGVSH